MALSFLFVQHVQSMGKLFPLGAVYAQFLASVYRRILLDIIFILLLKHLITQTLCQGSINY